ncbi:MAG TPA: hypothetical protein PKN10_10335 [Chitinophagaceae bacterium]|jgi:hypothetical protein|nr:hypothetical protein [Chitinophagaceae bacterium]HNJ56565.1 hypothetical protein [Chitinophagaceae bacterium]HNK61558.1 hypothetical protein [Chitinophagaceae bacterium]HNL60561.1 hypothetical protein [Chitinophagaceae bacterium]HNO00159.1 hypothetical protein [Chitinophagaceae bacterium]
MKIRLLLLFTSVMTVLCTDAQVKGDSATSPGGHFSTNGSRKFWMGTNYRKEWNTPLTVPVINLSTEHGGLTPVKRGGGKQTKSLRLEDPQGKQYTFRSIAKFITSKTLPGDLQSEAAADLVSDGVSASYPYAALSMAVLSEAAGVPHGNPKLVYVPDDPKLGEFRADFGNMMVLYEERQPDSVNKVWDTDEVVEKLEKDNDNDVDQLALLRVRILDMFVMDLDRHEGQWNWGAYENGKGKTYYPIAKDRDQAFYINQGLLPGFVKGRALVPQLEGFKPKAKSIERFNFAARNLDRFFLNQLTEQEWKQEAERMVARMTDDVIDRALAVQPREIKDISAEKIAQTLKERRKYLVDEVMQYYHFLANTVSITGSNKKELYNITRGDDGSMLVQVYKISKEGNQSTKMYERRFDPMYTKELRIYGLDGDDKFVVNGENDKIKLRLIGGDGQDAFDNLSKGRPEVLVYDRADGGNTLTGGFKNKMVNDSFVNKFERIYYKYPYQSVFVTGGFNPDDGVFLGPTFKYIRHGFRKDPYKSLNQFKFKYAFSTGAFQANYLGEFISVFGRRTDLVANIDYRGPNNTNNFFGYGMGSVYDKTKTGKYKYYRIRYDLGDIALQIRHRFSDKVMLYVGPDFQFYSYDSTDKYNKIRNVEIDPLSGLNQGRFDKRQSYLGGKLLLTVDTRNHKVLPGKGISWNTAFNIMSGMGNNSYKNVSQLNSDLSFYVSLAKDWLIWANRIGAGVTMAKSAPGLTNNFEFFQAQFLGSNEDLRGFRRERFAGSSKFFNQSELRLKLANLKTYLFPASIGLFAFVDAGRVWQKGITGTNKMAVGYGGGIWFSPLKRFVLTLSYAMSDEDKLPLFGFGWKF